MKSTSVIHITVIPGNLSEGSQIPITPAEAVTRKVKGFVSRCPGTLKNSY